MKLTELYGVDNVERAIELLRDGALMIVQDDMVEEDRDHGTWTDRYVIEYIGRFYEVFIEYFAQGEVDYDLEQYTRDLKEVYPEVITKTVYK